MSAEVPEHCPGTDSEEAGKASACQGCPNQKICASAQPAPPDPALPIINQRFEDVKHKLLVGTVLCYVLFCSFDHWFFLHVIHLLLFESLLRVYLCCVYLLW